MLAGAGLTATGTGRCVSHYPPNAVTTLTRPRGLVARCAGADRSLRRRAMTKRRSGAILTRLHLEPGERRAGVAAARGPAAAGDPRPAAARGRAPAVEPGPRRGPRRVATDGRRRCSSASRRRASSRCATARAPSWPRRCPSRSRRLRRPTARRAMPRPPRSSELGARLLSLEADIEVRDNRAVPAEHPGLRSFPLRDLAELRQPADPARLSRQHGIRRARPASSRCAGRSPAISRCTAVTPATRSRSSSRPARMRPS